MERLSRNFIWMAAANLVGSLFTIIITVYLARRLLPTAFGYLAYVQSIIFYLWNFVDLGLTTYGIREVSKDRARVSDYVSEIVSFKLSVAAIIFMLFIFFVLLSRQADILKLLLIESSLLLFTGALFTEWAFQGVEKMYMVFISFATTTILQLSLLSIFIKGPDDLLKVPLIYFISAMPIALIFLRRFKFRLMIRKLDLKRIRLYLSSSLIIWLITISAQIYNNLDIVLLGLLRSAKEVGYFSIARRAVGGVTFLLIFLSNAALPRLSSTYCEDLAAFWSAVKKFLKVGAALTIFVLIPILIFSKEIIALTVGREYELARLPLNIMIVALIFVLFNLPFSTGLIAACFEKEVLKQTAFCACVSVILNLLLMPRYGMIGAAVSFLIVEAVAFTWISYVFIRKMVRT